MSIVQSSSVVSQFRPYQCEVHVQLYLSPCNDGSVVESTQVPPFWHGIDAQDDAAPGAGDGDGGGGGACASHVKPI